MNTITGVCDTTPVVSGPEPLVQQEPVLQAATLHVALPRASAITDVLLSPVGAATEIAELDNARELVVGGLRHLARIVPAGTPLRIDAYRIQLALRAPQQLRSVDQSFSLSPASCRRAIGTEAVSLCVRNPSLPPAQAVAEVLHSATVFPQDTRPSAWWAEWFRRIPTGARSVVQSEAVTWATQLYGALEWRRFDSHVRVGGDFKWECPGTERATLHAKVDVQILVESRPVFFVVPTGVPGKHWSATLSLAALGAGLVDGAGSVPARVVGIWPASGQVRILPVEKGTLDRAARLVVEAARALARSGVPDAHAPNSPMVGRFCP